MLQPFRSEEGAKVAVNYLVLELVSQSVASVTSPPLISPPSLPAQLAAPLRLLSLSSYLCQARLS